MRVAFAIAAGFILALSSLAARAEAAFGPLLAPEQLSEIRAEADPLILDIRGDASVYGQGHIPGAVHAPYRQFRGPAENPGEMLSEAKLTEVLRSLGVTDGRPIVIVHQGSDATDFGAAARVYWTLKSAGLEDLAILNGGMNAWAAEASAPLSTQAPEVRPSEIVVTISDRWLATREDVREIVEGDETARLLDARPQAFHEGETAHPAAAKPGTLPQADYFEHSGWFGSGPAIVDAEAARKIAQENGLISEQPLVSFCNTGHWAATNWFALSELAGIENVKLYPESMVGWSNAGLEMQNDPSLIENFLSQIRKSF